MKYTSRPPLLCNSPARRTDPGQEGSVARRGLSPLPNLEHEPTPGLVHRQKTPEIILLPPG